MKHGVKIRDHNVRPHLDIENDIQEKKNGLFTFTLRTNAGNIVDYNVTETVNVQDRYLASGTVVGFIVQQHSLSRNDRE